MIFFLSQLLILYSEVSIKGNFYVKSLDMNCNFYITQLLLFLYNTTDLPTTWFPSCRFISCQNVQRLQQPEVKVYCFILSLYYTYRKICFLFYFIKFFELSYNIYAISVFNLELEYASFTVSCYQILCSTTILCFRQFLFVVVPSFQKMCIATVRSNNPSGRAS